MQPRWRSNKEARKKRAIERTGKANDIFLSDDQGREAATPELFRFESNGKPSSKIEESLMKGRSALMKINAVNESFPVHPSEFQLRSANSQTPPSKLAFMNLSNISEEDLAWNFRAAEKLSAESRKERKLAAGEMSPPLFRRPTPRMQSSHLKRSTFR